MFGQVKKVDGEEVKNLKHLCDIVENYKGENLRIDLDDERVIVLNYKTAALATSNILRLHRIPAVMSTDLMNDQKQLQN